MIVSRVAAPAPPHLRPPPQLDLFAGTYLVVQGPLIESRPNAGDVDELRRQAGRGNATADAQLAESTAEDVSHCRDGLRSSTAPGRNGVVDRAKAPVKVVVDEADVSA